MNQQLIPIIASYWGAECSYESVFKGVPFTEQIYLNEYSFYAIPYQSFKLHLRPLWSITEGELRELGEVLLADNPHTPFVYEEVGHQKQLRFPSVAGGFLVIYDNGYFWYEFNNPQLINHLRAKGFCVDQELVDAGLVEWKNN